MLAAPCAPLPVLHPLDCHFDHRLDQIGPANSYTCGSVQGSLTDLPRFKRIDPVELMQCNHYLAAIRPPRMEFRKNHRTAWFPKEDLSSR